MRHKLGLLGLVAIAALALSAVTASTAVSAEFTSGSDNTELTAQALSIQLFTEEEAHWECEKVSLDETTLGTAQSEITAAPTFGACTTGDAIHGSLPAQIDVNGCHFLLTAVGQLHLVCPEGAEIKVTEKILGTFRQCLDIHAQTPTTSNIDYTNVTDSVTGKTDIKVESTIEGITYEKTGSCAFGDIEKNDWIFEGQFTLTGVNASTGKPVDVAVN